MGRERWCKRWHMREWAGVLRGKGSELNEQKARLSMSDCEQMKTSKTQAPSQVSRAPKVPQICLHQIGLETPVSRPSSPRHRVRDRVQEMGHGAQENECERWGARLVSQV